MELLRREPDSPRLRRRPAQPVGAPGARPWPLAAVRRTFGPSWGCWRGVSFGTQSFRWALAGIFALALAVRVTYNLTIARNYVPRHDAGAYVLLAQHVLKWGCYCLYVPGHPTTYRPPVFPLFLALTSLVSGFDPLHLRLALSVVGALTCLLVCLIARDLFGARVGALAGLMAAFYPQLFIYDAWLYSESLAICLFVASCLAVMRVTRHPAGWRWALVGGLIGITALTRPNGVYALGAVAAWIAVALWARLIPAQRALAGGALIVVGCLAVMAPWTVRNYVVTGGAFVPISTGGGDVIAGAYNDAAYMRPGHRGGWVNALTLPSHSPLDQALHRFPADCWGRCEITRNHVATELGLQWAASHLQLLPQLALLRMVQLWTPDSPTIESGMPIWRPFAVGYPTLVLVLAALGLVAQRRRWRAALLPWLFGASVVVGAVIFYGSPRMRAPLEPILLVMAAGGLAAGIAWSCRWLARSAGPTGSTVTRHLAGACESEPAASRVPPA